MCASGRGRAVSCWGWSFADPPSGGRTGDRVDLPAPARDVDGGASGCACLATGSVVCWRGERHRDAPPVFERVAGLPPCASLSLGGGNACVVDRGGGLWCWGWNDDGQVGDGTFDLRDAPVRVEGLGPVRRVVVGFLSTCALLANGEVACWGDRAGGLGDGTGASAPPDGADVVGLPPP